MGMPFIIMWKFGLRECLLVLTGDVISVRLIDGLSVVQEIRVTSPEAALRLAERWEVEEQRAMRLAARPLPLAVSA
jgi:hypothetical protein